MKQYIIVREDLPPGAIAAQSCHAMKLFTLEHPQFNEIENLVLLGAPSEGALKHILEQAKKQDLPCSAFYEPDFNNSLTAIGMPYGARRLLSTLPLALRTHQSVSQSPPAA